MSIFSTSTNHGGRFGNVRARILAIAATAMTVLFLFPAYAFADVGQPPVELPPLEEVECASFIVVNRSNGETIISKQEDARIYPASMTKIMTVALALEYLDTDAYVTVSQTAMDATTPNSTMMGLKVGEQVKISELLYGAMLPSGNDAANVLGESVVLAVKGSEAPVDTTEQSLIQQFAVMMNTKATELGLSNTHFVNTNGLHSEEHYTTASELAAIFEFALSFEEFRTVINTPTHVFEATNIHTFDGWCIARNTNYLMNDPWILGEDTKVVEVVGGKTGTTIDAGTGMTLLAVNKNGDEMITVVCGIPYSSANRQTTYVAAVLNAGAQTCFDADPVIRIEGNVMSHKPYNAPEGVGPEIQNPTNPTTQTSETLQTDNSGDTTASSKVTQPSEVPEKDSSSLGKYLADHPIITGLIILVFLIVLAIILLVIIPAVVRRKRGKRRISGFQGIKRI
jgi:D-alanyl-D-alanine carboxypeptidase